MNKLTKLLEQLDAMGEWCPAPIRFAAAEAREEAEQTETEIERLKKQSEVVHYVAYDGTGAACGAKIVDYRDRAYTALRVTCQFCKDKHPELWPKAETKPAEPQTERIIFYDTENMRAWLETEWKSADDNIRTRKLEAALDGCCRKLLAMEKP